MERFIACFDKQFVERRKGCECEIRGLRGRQSPTHPEVSAPVAHLKLAKTSSIQQD
jgi:hypothetical protein